MNVEEIPKQDAKEEANKRSPKIGVYQEHVLLAVARLGENAYSAKISAYFRESETSAHSPGAVSTTLNRLEEKGMLTSKSLPPEPYRGGRSRRLFSITEIGIEALELAELTRRRIQAISTQTRILD